MEIYLLDDPSIDKRTVIQKAGTAAVNQKMGMALMVDKLVQDDQVDTKSFELGKLALVDTGAEWKIALVLTEAEGKVLAQEIASHLAGVIGWKLQRGAGGNDTGD